MATGRLDRVASGRAATMPARLLVPHVGLRLALVAICTLAGCTSGTSLNDGPSSTETTAAAESSSLPSIDTPLPSPSRQVNVYALTKTFTMEDSIGRKVRVTFAFSDAIRADNSEVRDSTWQRMGGTSPTACFEPTGDIASRYEIKMIRMWVGKASFENLTPDYGWTDLSFNVRPEPSSSGHLPLMMVGEGYSDGTDCGSGLDLGVPSDTSSGQLPFVMVELDAYTPNTPQGADPPLVSIVSPLPMADDQRVISVRLPD